MSAGICIMNKNAIAMAADSAVTIISQNNINASEKHSVFHNSANKLFALSKVAPIGLIVYSAPEFMSVPIEIIIKKYKNYLENKTFPKLEDYFYDFKKYIEKNSNAFGLAKHEEIFVSNVMLYIIKFANTIFHDSIRVYGAKIDSNLIINAFQKSISSTYNFIDSFKKKSDSNFFDYVKEKYFELFISMIKNDPFLKILKENEIKEFCEKVCSLFDTNFDLNNYLGITIAGYGEDELYPCMLHLRLHGIINSSLKYETIDKITISDDVPSSITPLAQTEVMETFLAGINEGFISDLSYQLPDEVFKRVNSMDDFLIPENKKNEINELIRETSANIINNLANHYKQPIQKSIKFLPIDELALFAESMINITSLRRKVVLDQYIGTVGGPIDVAVISKGDGFIWTKRKHYFDKDYNPQYFYSHYKTSYDIRKEEKE